MIKVHIFTVSKVVASESKPLSRPSVPVSLVLDYSKISNRRPSKKWTTSQPTFKIAT